MDVVNFTMLLAVSLITTSCTKDDGLEEGPEGTEQGTGEGAEGNHTENGNEQGESGTRWAIDQTADEVINGIHAIISYNSTTDSFEGTFENLNSNVAQQTRLETHVFDANGNSFLQHSKVAVFLKRHVSDNMRINVVCRLRLCHRPLYYACGFVLQQNG